MPVSAQSEKRIRIRGRLSRARKKPPFEQGTGSVLFSQESVGNQRRPDEETGKAKNEERGGDPFRYEIAAPYKRQRRAGAEQHECPKHPQRYFFYHRLL